jgi:undecaprenyl-diphosphatase
MWLSFRHYASGPDALVRTETSSADLVIGPTNKRFIRLALGGIGLFVAIGVLVQLRLLVGVDFFLMRLKQPLGNSSLDALAEASALLVSTEFCVVYAAVAAGLLWRAGAGRWSLAPFGFLALEFVELGLKYIVDQPPPPSEFYRQIYYPLTTLVIGGSFPSGHAMRSAFLFVFLTVVVGMTVRRPEVRLIQAAAVLFCLFCAFSRVYLGYHWPSDVVAGLVLGASAGLLCTIPVTAARYRRRPGDGRRFRLP